MTPTKQMQMVLDEYATFNAPPVPSLTPENARQLPTIADAAMSSIARHAMARAMKPVPEPIAMIDHKLIPTPTGDILARLYYPEGNGPFPVVVYFHGGGWVIANLDTYDSSCRALAKSSESVVVSVAYRQAPEHPYPAAAEDAFAAFRWVSEHASEINGTPEAIAVAGESAGGNLAAVVCLMAAEQGVTMPVHQVLVYPITDMSFDTPSYAENANAKPLDKAAMMWFWKHYVKEPARGTEPHASPLRAPDLSAMPPTTIVLAEIDPLRSDGEMYGERLREAGVRVESRCYMGVTHEFFGLAAGVDEAKEAIEFVSDQLKLAFTHKEPMAMGAATSMS